MPASRDDAWPASGVCQAVQGCAHPACFQARAEGSAGPRQIRRRADACGRHLGDLVQFLSAWARDSSLTEGQLTVLAVEPGRAGPGLTFSIIPIPP